MNQHLAFSAAVHVRVCRSPISRTLKLRPFSSLPSSLVDQPTLALLPPGRCQFTSNFQKVPLFEKFPISSTSAVFRFGLPDPNSPLNLSTCACILAGAHCDETSDALLVRPYTPISTNAQVGHFDLLVKNYGDNGTMSRHMHALDPGDMLEFKHIDFNVKIQAPFSQKRIGMLVGGTGVAPMIQALHAILGDIRCQTKVSMLYGSQVSHDILGRELLDKWCELHSDRLSVTHVLSQEDENSEWNGERGFINESLIAKHMPSPSLDDDVIIFVCGPAPMYDALCGAREDKELSGILAKLGYHTSQVYKF